jgi:peptide/nickel transport system permease protein
MMWSLGLGIPLGISAALRRNTRLDLGISAASLTSLSIPVFFRGILLILFLAVYNRIFPSGGYVDFGLNPMLNLKTMFLPSLSLGLGLAGVIVRYTRSSMIDVMGKEYITTAYAKGLPKRIIISRHALKNALNPVVTAAGLQFGTLLGGVVITETLFSVPGVGSLLVNSIYQRDYPVVQGAVLFVTVVFVLTNLLVDLLYTVIDPRVRYES